MKFSNQLFGATVLGAALLLALPAHAAGNTWDSAAPWADVSGATVLAEWNRFNAISDDSPDVAGAGSVTETTGLSSVTSTGNIYNYRAVSSFSAVVEGLDGAANVWLQVATQGTALATDALLNGLSATLVSTFSGSDTEVYWLWEGVTADVYNFSFAATTTHLSLDQLAVAAVPVPEPSSYAMLVAGLSALGAAVRRRRADPR